MRRIFQAFDGQQPGNPEKGARLIVEALTNSGRAKGRKLPSRLPLGEDAIRFIDGVVGKQKQSLEEWRDLAVTTDISYL